MARRTLNRFELRRAAESAEAGPAVPGDSADESDTAKPNKAVNAPKVAKPRKSSKAKVPDRMRVRWEVVNSSLKQIAVFDYPHRSEADQKAADLIGKGKGHHFVRAIKEPMSEPGEAS